MPQFFLENFLVAVLLSSVGTALVLSAWDVKKQIKARGREILDAIDQRPFASNGTQLITEDELTELENYFGSDWGQTVRGRGAVQSGTTSSGS